LHGRVLIDADAVGRMAGAYLADRGFRNFAMFIRLRHEAETLAMRGFNALLKSRGFSVRECCWESMRDEYHSRAWTERQKWFGRELGKLSRPAGVFVWDDVFASELIDACTSFGIAVPEDVAVLGAYNDAEICDLAPIPFSSIDVNLELLGYRAAEMLDGIMRGERPPKKPLLIPPKSVVTRVSTDILAIDDACVAKAMRFFQERYADPMLTVDHVVEHMHLSKRSLYVAFQKRMGRAPHQELMRLRIEKSKELLLNTPLQMKEIWGASGFSSLHHMYQVFKRDVGMPPQQYRAQHSPGESR
jgi:LacI family transcriptional regulator